MESSKEDLILEILELARDILDRGASRGCLRCEIQVADVRVIADFAPEAPDLPPMSVAHSPAPKHLTPEDIKFPGMA